VEIRGVFIEDTFAEAFGMRAARVVITARTMKWARAAALKLTGFATSVIACKCEAAIERELTPEETPDARPGVSALLFTMDTDSLGKRLTERIGQTVLTCPTASCFDGLPDAPDRLPAARAAHFRRSLPDQQGGGRRALLARAGDGRGVPPAGKLRHAEEGRGRR
jgi:formylmethanofuran--tetrahydromethanopterin N-formyltransferase